ncbi:hypothetical protein [Halobacteriovorax sp. JY17]|uniref:methyltransferase family protein n=1 Tax=Halobacteriovorax sp. JY17 TaxID=2014617 RepID=UPI000C3B2E29|nr:hypothetical protein [Halobacteriovorax sp. JY17]PIK14864.1 MAG: hypothetical protein CES88_11065 [Halobacteriovorax sp. JY17]
MEVKQFLEKRYVFITIGIINIVLFHYAIIRLWFFLLDSTGRYDANSVPYPWTINTTLLCFFSIPHSLLLNSNIKRKLLSYIPGKLYSTIYSLHSCIAIILLDEFWTSIGTNLIISTGLSSTIILVFYTLSWLFMFWTMSSIGLFKQSGIEEWWKAVRKKRLKGALVQHGPYKICRHPIYVAFLGMIWFTPNMSEDRLYLSLFWSAYIFIGATFKEMRLSKSNVYREYSKKVPAFPLFPKKLDNFISKKIWSV